MKRHNQYLALIFILTTVTFLTGCNVNSMYDQSYDIPQGKWSKKQTIIFDVPVTDTINGYNLLVNVRNNNEYPYSNCYFFISTRSPKGIILHDTLQFNFADDHGKWLGKGFGGVWSNSLHYKNNIRFPMKGNYRVEVHQAMRDEPLKGLMDVGLRIERVK